MAVQIERKRVYQPIEIVNAIKSGGGVDLSEYFPPEIADALQSLIDDAIKREREDCARVAEEMGEPGGAYAPHDPFEPDPKRQAVCEDIAKAIRHRR